MTITNDATFVSIRLGITLARMPRKAHFELPSAKMFFLCRDALKLVIAHCTNQIVNHHYGDFGVSIEIYDQRQHLHNGDMDSNANLNLAIRGRHDLTELGKLARVLSITYATVIVWKVQRFSMFFI